MFVEFMLLHQQYGMRHRSLLQSWFEQVRDRILLHRPGVRANPVLHWWGMRTVLQDEPRLQGGTVLRRDESAMWNVRLPHERGMPHKPVLQRGLMRHVPITARMHVHYRLQSGAVLRGREMRRVPLRDYVGMRGSSGLLWILIGDADDQMFQHTIRLGGFGRHSDRVQ